MFQALRETAAPRARDGSAAVFPVFHRILADAQGFGQGIAGAESQGRRLAFSFSAVKVFINSAPLIFEKPNPDRRPSSLLNSSHVAIDTPTGPIFRVISYN
jgi:hypothetical protein